MNTSPENDRAPQFHGYPLPLCVEEGNMSSHTIVDRLSFLHNSKSDSVEKVTPTSTSLSLAFNSFLPPQYHQHHESTSTSASDSTDSSPTTTVSIADDSSVTEMSPGSSPESPMAKASISTLSNGSNRPHTSDEALLVSPSAPFFDLQRPLTPGKKPRNLKNLAVNTTGALGAGRAASTPSVAATETLDALPALRQTQSTLAKLPSPTKRRPSNLSLTIMTPANKGPHRPTQLAIPPTPSLSRPSILRHFQSSPSLPLYSHLDSTDALLSPFSKSQQAHSIPSPKGPLLNSGDEQNFDVPQSREEKPEAYPDGPICVYEPHVDLYLEPTATQGMRYDVILNVASEVKNPFLHSSTPISPTPEFRLDGGGGIQYAQRRNSDPESEGSKAISAVQKSSPSTPKATPLREDFHRGLVGPAVTPEYIHIPWEHNTDIVPDLLRLVKLIDDRVLMGKRVLVHCQCGVSRSATLVVAYCLYKHPEMSVQEAYDSIKRRSKWIGPNMNLIMQLQEFRSTLTGSSRRNVGLRSLTPIEASSSWQEWRKSGRLSNGRLEPLTPKTAPLPPPMPSSPGSSTQDRSGTITPGPSSAPSGILWPASSNPAPRSRNAKDARSVSDASAESPGRMIPLIKAESGASDFDGRGFGRGRLRPRSLVLDNRHHPAEQRAPPVVSPRSGEFAMAPLQPSLEVAPEDRFGLMSPSASEFVHSPLDRAGLLGALGMGSAFQSNGIPRIRHSGSLAPQAPQSLQKDSNTEGDLVPIKDAPGTVTATHALEQKDIVHHVAFKQESRDEDPLMSPRAFEFTQSPFAPSQLLPLRPTASEFIPVVEDPRSPAQKGSESIIRSIADAL